MVSRFAKFICIKFYHIYRKIRAKCERLKQKIMVWELEKTPNIETDKSAMIYPEAQLIAPFSGNCIVIGANSFVRGNVQCLRGGGKVKIGAECYIGDGTRIWSSSSINIGNRVLIAHNCNIFDSTTHPIDAKERNDDFINICFGRGWNEYATCYSAPINIEDDAWIGCNSVILRGVTIGEGAIVGAGSVVTKDVPPYTVVVGNPARITKRISKA